MRSAAPCKHSNDRGSSLTWRAVVFWSDSGHERSYGWQEICLAPCAGMCMFIYIVDIFGWFGQRPDLLATIAMFVVPLCLPISILLLVIKLGARSWTMLRTWEYWRR